MSNMKQKNSKQINLPVIGQRNSKNRISSTDSKIL